MVDEWKFAEQSLGVDKRKSKPQVVMHAAEQQPKTASKLTTKSPKETPAVKGAAVTAPATGNAASMSKSQASAGEFLETVGGKWMKEMESAPLSLFG